MYDYYAITEFVKKINTLFISSTVRNTKCPNMVIHPHPRFFYFLKLFKHFINMVPMMPRPLSGDNFKPSYHEKRVLDIKYPNMVIRSQTPPRKLFFINFLKSLEASYNYGSNEPSTTIR